MRRILLLAGCIIGAVIIRGAPPLTIQPAVEVKIGTNPNRIYQLEVAYPDNLAQWIPIGPAKWGRGQIVTSSVPITTASQLVIRSHEYDMTNAIAAYLPWDGNGVDPTWQSSGGGSTFFRESRFGTPYHAAYHSLTVDGRNTLASVQLAQGPNDFSISLWEASEPFSGSFGTILMSVAGGTNSLQLVLMATNQGAIELYFGGGQIPLLVSGALAWEFDRWYCFQLVRRGNVFKMYRDLELVGQKTSEVPNTQRYINFYFGPENGSVDEVRFYNRALSEEELGLLFRLEEH